MTASKVFFSALGGGADCWPSRHYRTGTGHRPAGPV